MLAVFAVTFVVTLTRFVTAVAGVIVAIPAAAPLVAVITVATAVGRSAAHHVRGIPIARTRPIAGLGDSTEAEQGQSRGENECVAHDRCSLVKPTGHPVGDGWQHGRGPLTANC
jgi:hypothetical protein